MYEFCDPLVSSLWLRLLADPFCWQWCATTLDRIPAKVVFGLRQILVAEYDFAVVVLAP